MRRLKLFLIVTVAALASLVAVVFAGYVVLSASSAQNSYQSNWMGQMWQGMGGMMGGNSGTTGAQVQSNAVAPFLGIAFVVLAALAIIGIVGLIYFMVLPEIRVAQSVSPAVNSSFVVQATAHVLGQSAEIPSYAVASTPYESVLKTLTGSERKVVEVLVNHKGRYLQKYIRNETGLSRLQTHRIVARLAERGIVTLEKTGNTNTVLLASWLK